MPRGLKVPSENTHTHKPYTPGATHAPHQQRHIHIHTIHSTLRHSRKKRKTKTLLTCHASVTAQQPPKRFPSTILTTETMPNGHELMGRQENLAALEYMTPVRARIDSVRRTRSRRVRRPSASCCRLGISHRIRCTPMDSFGPKFGSTRRAALRPSASESTKTGQAPA